MIDDARASISIAKAKEGFVSDNLAVVTFFKPAAVAKRFCLAFSGGTSIYYVKVNCEDF